jgi:hypothetical protein
MHLKVTEYLESGLDASSTGYGPLVDFCSHGNESSSFKREGSSSII